MVCAALLEAILNNPTFALPDIAAIAPLPTTAVTAAVKNDLNTDCPPTSVALFSPLTITSGINVVVNPVSIFIECITVSHSIIPCTSSIISIIDILSYGFNEGSPITHISPSYISLTDCLNTLVVTFSATALLTLPAYSS